MTYEDIARAVAQKNAAGAIRMLMAGNPPGPRFGRRLETDLWDFKKDCPGPARDDRSENAWAHISADVLAFHNNRGGMLIFGIDDSTFDFTGATRRLDSKQFNDRIRRYVGDLLWVDFIREYIQADQRYLGIALIPPRGPVIARFKSNAPTINGRRLFDRGGSALREGDSSRILDPTATDRFVREQEAPRYGDRYAVDKPYYRVLAPEYLHFLQRGALGERVERSLCDPRVAVTSLIGVGGLGKTALATWAVNRAYDRDNQFDFIVSTTAKDRELSATGILGLTAQLTSYEDLLDQVAEVLGFPDLKSHPIQEREDGVRALLESGAGLLYVDNLETVDDKRLIEFLNDLPQGVRALVTSRRNSIRTAARPIDIPPLSDTEVRAYLSLLAEEPAFAHLRNMNEIEARTFGRAWDGIPLALRWASARTKSVPELLQQANALIGQRQDGAQLLEFSFRRVFDKLRPAERAVLETLSILEQSIPTEAIVAGAGVPDSQALDALEDLVDDAMIQRVFDPDRNDYCFRTLPITRAFTRGDLQKRPTQTRTIQRRLTGWFEAADIVNEEDRLVVREIRAGRNADDTALVDLALSADRRDDHDGAERLFRQALARNPRSWRAARAAAEFYRHKRRDHIEALNLYEIAGANAPRRGNERALIFREWGLLLRDSGQPGAASRAEEKLKVATTETPDDPVARHGLATCLDKRGAYREVISLLEPVRHTRNERTRKMTLPLLLKAYERGNEMLKAAQLRSELS